MEFNVNKCKVMHYGFNNPSYTYLMNDAVLIDTEEERDFGITTQVMNVILSYGTLLGTIRRCFHYKDRKTILVLYKSMARPHLEYTVETLCPNKIINIKQVERVQQRITKCIPELNKLPYEMRLKNLNLTTLETITILGELRCT